MKRHILLIAACCLAIQSFAENAISAPSLHEKNAIGLFADKLPDGLTQNNAVAQPVLLEGSPALDVTFNKAEYPNVFFNIDASHGDWSKHHGIAIDIRNPEKEAVRASVRVDNAGADGINHCNTASALIEPGSHAVLRLTFATEASRALWGMRGLPFIGPIGSGSLLDTQRIVAFQVFLARPDKPTRLLLSNFRLFTADEKSGEIVKLPFIDRYGQFNQADWEGKMRSESEFAARRQAEEKELAASPSMPDLDAWQGWMKGPQLEASGYFRTEKVDGKWWLVTPHGHLFFSAGIDCVGTWEQTFVTGRDGWFEWLPGMGDRAGEFYSQVSGAHSMSENIEGKGRVFNFYRANLQRRYGANWASDWERISAARLPSWGFNTLGNWSEAGICDRSHLPFVVSINTGGAARRLEGIQGYWGAMIDVFDPRFADVVDESVAPACEKFSSNPYCIGFFSDNELAWETIKKGVLSCPVGQPCRAALIQRLMEKHKTIEALNAAWAVQADSWDSLKTPDPLNAIADKDLNEFAYEFAHRYFSTIRNSLRTHAPHHLYLGCRFASYSDETVKACADVADVVSFNIYQTGVRTENALPEGSADKPVLVGEFHFGALDRGLFHPGLVQVQSQLKRGEAYEKYLESALLAPEYVGCHWFQYVDEPTTGRWFDGENYNIGFVDVTDTPYPEMVSAARRIHSKMYELRYKGR